MVIVELSLGASSVASGSERTKENCVASGDWVSANLKSTAPPNTPFVAATLIRVPAVKGFPFLSETVYWKI
jgi:hypothetical protein